MQNNIRNSSGNTIGTITIDSIITIQNRDKPLLVIDDQNDIDRILNKDRSIDFLVHLYDDYYLEIGEIAALYGVCYSNINKIHLEKQANTKPYAGRRNRAYGKHISDKQKQKMSASLKGRKNTHYERTPEIRKKISESLKKHFKETPQDPTAHRKNWANGLYDSIDFHHGIGGSFYSVKNKCRYYFRSLLELWYMLSLESNCTISSYKFEPFHITCDDDTIYTPDILINDSQVIELKSKKYLQSLPDENYKRFLYKVDQATKYCEQHGFAYEVVYDIDIDFDNRRTKRHLQNHPEIIEEYHILFNQPERMVIK